MVIVRWLRLGALCGISPRASVAANLRLAACRGVVGVPLFLLAACHASERHSNEPMEHPMYQQDNLLLDANFTADASHLLIHYKVRNEGALSVYLLNRNATSGRG